MPAERTRGSKRKAEDPTWTTSIDASKPQNIAFAPNVTPGTFNDPPSPVDPPPESMLFPPTPDSPTGRRQAHGKKKPENHIPRPPNAFILFRSSFINNKHVSSDVETNHSTLSKIIGLTWHNLPHEERQIWHTKAKIALEEHRRKYPQYAFRPLHAKAKGGGEKRKVREVGPKDMKRCARIAELLAEGKKGEELNAAIAEFDRNHVPEIVTRFEAPITARTYRRSSSAPIPDTEHSKPAFLQEPSSKPRASSIEPGTATQEAYSDCESPSSSQADVEASEYQYELPASPVDATPTYTLPEPNPSFDFNTFSFNTSTAPTTFETYDPLFSNSQESVFDGYSPQDTNAPCTPHADAFVASGLTIDTSFLNAYPPSSPFSSMPSTPQTYPQAQSPAMSMMNSEIMSMPYDASYDFFPDLSNYTTDVAPNCMPATPMSFATHEYSMGPKADFASFYDKSSFVPMEHGFASSYLTAVPAYGM
ncbi:unnamed protein product [Somion occarium]|uniref:HMG box domain-containing protein n=1 Tax=Somion occarium TaxID=3059160 RepID=A0ABP1CVY3_9APHY